MLRRLILSFSAVAVLLACVISAQGSRYVLRIQNASQYDIYHLYVSSSENRKWGPDQLGNAVIRANGTFTLTDLVTGEYDVKFVDEDGDPCVIQNVKVTQDTSWKVTTDWLLKCEFHQTATTSGQTSRYSLTIQNTSTYDIHQLYVSSSENRRWGPDQLGRNILRANRGTFTLTDLIAGQYDVKFVDEDGDACVVQNIKLTQDASWKVTTDWLLKCEFH